MAKTMKIVYFCFVVLALISVSIPEVSSGAIAVVEKTAEATALGVAASVAGNLLEWVLYIPSLLVRHAIRSITSFVLAPLLIPIRIVQSIFKIVTFPVRLIWNVISFPIKAIVNIIMLPFRTIKAIVHIPRALLHLAAKIIF